MKSTVALVLALAALSACTSTTKGEGPGGSTSSSSSGSSSSGTSGTSSGTTASSSGGISGAQCQSACFSKLNECNPDHPDKFTACQDLCSAGNYTATQLDCFKNASCVDLANATYLEDLCPP